MIIGGMIVLYFFIVDNCDLLIVRIVEEVVILVLYFLGFQFIESLFMIVVDDGVVCQGFVV